jgi:outer membrane cobalamin receptor
MMRIKALLALTFITVYSSVMAAQADMEVSLQDVVVTGTRSATNLRYLPAAVSVIDSAKLTENKRYNVLPTLTEQIPGLFVTGRAMMGYGVSGGSSGNISLRGLSGGAGRMLVLIDGHPQYQGIFGHPISDSYQTMMADHIEVLRGPASVLYGSNAMGGVINIVTRSMHNDGVRTNINLGGGSWGTFQAEAGNEVHTGKFSSTVTANYGRSDNHRPRMGFEQLGGYARLGYEISQHWNVYTDANVTHFNASYPGSTSQPIFDAKQWITRGVMTAAVENHYDNTSGAVSVYYNFGRHKINDGHTATAAPQTNYFRSNDALTGISFYQSAKLLKGNRLTLGFDYQNIFGHTYFTNIETGETADVAAMQLVNKHINETAGYVDVLQDITSWLTVDAGVRLDHHTITGSEWIPQGGIVIRPIATGEIKAMVSKGFRNPILREMYLYRPATEDLKPERIINYELSWNQHLLNGAVYYGINLFYLTGDNMIQTAMVNGVPQNVNTGKITNKGVEMEISYRVSDKWSLNTNHSFLNMKYHILAAPEYKGYIGANYRNGKWNVASGLQYINGLFTSVGTTEKKENFALLNCTVNYQLTKKIGLWLKGDNLLAQKYEINLGYPMPKATFMGGVNITI